MWPLAAQNTKYSIKIVVRFEHGVAPVRLFFYYIFLDPGNAGAYTGCFKIRYHICFVNNFYKNDSRDMRQTPKEREFLRILSVTWRDMVTTVGSLSQDIFYVA